MDEDELREYRRMGWSVLGCAAVAVILVIITAAWTVDALT